jgi:hypothetical protein
MKLSRLKSQHLFKIFVMCGDVHFIGFKYISGKQVNYINGNVNLSLSKIRKVSVEKDFILAMLN